jgi:mono/diheme cytochrome c family protein
MMKVILSLIILLLLNLSQSVLAAEHDQALFNQGKTVYEKVCIACHNYLPPPKNAPPMIGVSGHYHQTFTDRKQAVSHIANFIRQPAKEKSKLPPMAINAWGLMPPLAVPLSTQEVQAVSYWVWEIYNIECAKSAKSFFCQQSQQK